MTCRDCGERNGHCHGTLVRHADAAECTDPGCATPEPAEHALVIDCAELACPTCVAATRREAA